jgi:hypothetical protein
MLRIEWIHLTHVGLQQQFFVERVISLAVSINVWKISLLAKLLALSRISASQELFRSIQFSGLFYISPTV